LHDLTDDVQQVASELDEFSIIDHSNKEKSQMNTSPFKIIFASTLAFTGWHMGMDWLDSSSGKPFDPIKATMIRRSLLKIDWGNPGLCSSFSINYDAQSKRCGKRVPLYKRSSLYKNPS
jgi:hypothetical protein